MGESTLISLLVIVYLGCISPTVSSQFCPDEDMSYHPYTKTCIKVFTMKKDFSQASNKCGDYKGGNAKEGHLVYIFDENTNSFVKDLIEKAGVPEAYIGLHDRTIRGNYTWGKNGQTENDFRRWSNGEPNEDVGLRVRTVVITQNGWKKKGSDSPFVCQVDAVFPSPNLTCPEAAEVGKASSSIRCSLPADGLGRFMNVKFKSQQKEVVVCMGSRPCQQKHPGYTATVDGDYSATLTIDKVGTEHGGLYTCTYQFKDVPEEMSASCELKVYAVPSKPKCGHTFTETGVKVVCVTDKVYPEGGCSWSYRNYTFTQDLPATPNVSSQGGPRNEGKYFQTTCTTDVTISEAGSYEFKVIIFPDGFQHISNANNSNKVEVDIKPPPDRPILKSSSGFVDSHMYNVTENRIFTITCTAEGGSPKVRSTTMTCSKDVRNKDRHSTVTKNDTSVSIEINATREMNEGNCTCNAKHLVKNYKQDNFIQFSVIYPATVSNFEISSHKTMKSAFEASSGEEITLECKANGNPQPTMKIIPIDVNGRNTTLAQKNTTSSLSHQMRVSCRDSGKYVCRGRNDLNTEYSEKYLDLLVKCRLEHCDDKEENPKFGVATNKSVVIKVCVLGYPNPIDIKVAKDNRLLGEDKYKTKFQSNNEKTVRRDINITFINLQPTDLGHYTLYANNSVGRSSLKFRLVGQGPPSCPTEVQTVKTYSDTVTLSWKPGFNGGPAQTFIIQHQEGNEIAKEKDTEEDIMYYNITGLTENSPYTFSIDVTNSEGFTKCPDVFVNVTTKALPVSQDSSQTIYIIIAVVLIVILISIVIIILLVKRRSKKKELRQSAEYKVREAGEGESLVRGDEIEDLYASADINTEIGVKSKDAKSEKKKKDKKKEDKEKKKDKVKKKEEEDQDTVEATYAVVNKMPKKDKKGAECKAGEAGEGGSLVRGDETEDLYANVDISTEKGVKKKDAKPEKQKKDKKKEDKEKKKDKVKKKEEEDQDTMEATYAVVNKMTKKDKKDTKTKKSATKSKEDKKKKKGGGTEKPKDEVEVVIENDLYVKNSDLDNAEVVIENDLYAKSSDLGNAEVVIENDLYGKSSDLGNAEVVIENDLYGKSSDLGNAEVVIENDLYAKSSDLDKAEAVIENDLYGKSSDLTAYSNVEMCAGGQPDPPDESVYANETATSPPGQTLKSKEKEGKKGKKEEKKAEKDSGRTVNTDGLVYVTVEINPTTKKPEAKSDVPATSGATQPSKPKSKYDPVEYVVLDHTAKVNTEGKKEGSA